MITKLPLVNFFIFLLCLTTVLLVQDSAIAEMNMQPKIYRFFGTGVFSIVYKNSKTTEDCSRLLVELIESVDQIHLSTQFHCDDYEDAEDQEFVPLTLERKNDKLFKGKILVGSYQDHLVKIKLQVGKQIETYELDFHTEQLNFMHSSNLGSPGIGILSGILPAI